MGVSPVGGGLEDDPMEMGVSMEVLGGLEIDPPVTGVCPGVSVVTNY